MSLAVVQHTSGHGTGHASPPGSLTLGSTPTVGNLILVGLYTNTTNSALVISGSYTIVDQTSVLTGTGTVFGTLLARYVQSGDTTALPTFATGGNTYWSAVAYEVSGVAGTLAADVLSIVERQDTTGGTLVYATTLMQTAANNSLALAFFGNFGASANPTISGSGWSLDEAANDVTDYGSWGGASNALATAGSAVQVQITLTTSGAVPRGYMVVLLSPTAASAPLVRQVRSTQGAGAAGHPGAYKIQTPVVTGNLLIANIGWDSGGAIADPAIGSGWTLIDAASSGSSQTMIALYRYVQSGDAAGLPALTTSGAQNYSVNIFEISGVTGAIAQDVASDKVGYQASGTTMTTTADATTTTDQLVLASFAHFEGSNVLTSSSPGYDFVINSADSANYGSWGTLRQYFPASGATVQSTVTLNATTHPTSYIQLILGYSPSVDAVGSSTGQAAVVAVGKGLWFSVGGASGVGAAAAIPSGVENSVGTCAGHGTSSGVSATGNTSVGTSSGVGAANGVTTLAKLAIGTAAGAGTASGIYSNPAARTSTATGGGGSTAAGVVVGRVLNFDWSRAWSVPINGATVESVAYDPFTFVLKVIYTFGDLQIDVGDLPISTTMVIELSPDPEATVLNFVANAR